MSATEQDPVQIAAASVRAAAEAIVRVTAPVHPGDAGLPPTAFDRLSVERRALGHITDEVDVTALGPRNTLAALTYALMTDANTTHPPAGLPRLDVDGATVEQVAQAVLDLLSRLVGAGLASQRPDGSYAVTEAGVAELAA
jgi:hypothetical protein